LVSEIAKLLEKNTFHTPDKEVKFQGEVDSYIVDPYILAAINRRDGN
jgi:hypothetical protein